jgi:hypothetical protein
MWYLLTFMGQFARRAAINTTMTNDDETTEWLARSTDDWRSMCDLTLMLRQSRPASAIAGQHIDEAQARAAFRHFMNLLNRAVFGNAVRRHGKRVRVIAVLEKETEGPWHYHAAVEPPPHLTLDQFESLIRDCWLRVGWHYPDVLVRPGADSGWIHYMLKRRQKTAFDEHPLDCIDLDSFYNPDCPANLSVGLGNLNC